jgi:hypothetical protein
VSLPLPKPDPYTLPIQVVDPKSMTLSDAELITAMSEYTPVTAFRPGDLAYLTEAPPRLRVARNALPRMWQIRFVISAWAHEIMRLVHSVDRVMGIDHVISLLESQDMQPDRYRKPIVYAHGFPHGMYPDTTAWFPERVLRKVVLKDSNQPWPAILDEAKAPYLGYNESGLMVPYTFDLAPDLYSNGENLGKPFSFEEATTHTACLLGMEEVLFKPVDPYEINNPFAVDPQSDIFKRFDPYGRK